MLVLDAASGHCLVAAVDNSGVLAQRTDGERGAATERLPGLVAEVLALAGLAPSGLTAVAVTVGPGSFTGLRAALSFAHGLAAGADLALVGISLGEAFRAGVVSPDDRPLWVALDSRRGRIFLDRDGEIEVFDPAHLPLPGKPITVTGDAGAIVAAAHSAQGVDVRLDPATRASAPGIAAAARLRLSGQLPPRDVMPLYVDVPAAKPPDLRPAPV